MDFNSYVDEIDSAAGKKHVRRLLDRNEGYDLSQYAFWRNYLVQMALAGFEWEGLPSGINPRYVEWAFLRYGSAGFFIDEGGLMFAQAGYAGIVNMYDDPNEVVFMSPNGRTWQRHAQKHVEGRNILKPDCAVGFDSLIRQPLLPMLELYARRLATFDRIIDININAQKTPWIIAGSEESKKTRKGILKRLATNDQYFEVNDAAGGFGSTLPYTLNTNAPFVSEKIFEVKQKVLNEVLTLLGVDNTNSEKRERQVVDEVLANNEQIALLRRSRLETRRTLCERTRDVLGFELSVKWGVPHLMESDVSGFGGGGDAGIG